MKDVVKKGKKKGISKKIDVSPSTFEEFEAELKRNKEKSYSLFDEMEHIGFYSMRNAPSDSEEDGIKIIKSALQKAPGIYFYFSNNAKSIKSVVLEIVRTNGLTLADVCSDLQDDKEVVMEAVRQNPRAFEYASKRLKDDNELLLYVLERKPELIIRASYRAKKICKDQDPYVALLSHLREKEADTLRIELTINKPISKRKINKI